MMSGADVVYPSAGSTAHPAVGRWVPDLEVSVGGTAVRLAERARHGRPMLLCPLEMSTSVVSARADRVDPLTVTSAPKSCQGGAILVRPDGYVAWAGTELGELAAALQTWFGSPSRQI